MQKHVVDIHALQLFRYALALPLAFREVLDILLDVVVIGRLFI